MLKYGKDRINIHIILTKYFEARKYINILNPEKAIAPFCVFE